MPLVRISVRKGRSPSEKRALLDAVHSALVEAFHIPDSDRNQRLSEYTAEEFETPPGRTELYTLVEITAFPGRSPDAKANLYGALVRNLSALGTQPGDVLIVISEPSMENWGLRGTPASNVDLGFKVEV
ncbi:MAG: tautomerase family protein [Armatimonadetes bacterium]|nr:tautomerase family protein [Armatimonadota bacterium]